MNVASKVATTALRSKLTKNMIQRAETLIELKAKEIENVAGKFKNSGGGHLNQNIKRGNTYGQLFSKLHHVENPNNLKSMLPHLFPKSASTMSGITHSRVINEILKPNIFKNFKIDKKLIDFNKLPKTIEEAVEKLFLKIFNIEDQVFLKNFKKFDKMRKNTKRLIRHKDLSEIIEFVKNGSEKWSIEEIKEIYLNELYEEFKGLNMGEEIDSNIAEKIQKILSIEDKDLTENEVEEIFELLIVDEENEVDYKKKYGLGILLD